MTTVVVGILVMWIDPSWAQSAPNSGGGTGGGVLSMPKMELSLGGGEGDWVGALRILSILTLMTLGPGMLLTMTSFTRIVIVFSLMRQALGTQQSPPNQVVIALALFLTAFIMQPVWGEIKDKSLLPYLEGSISQTVAFDRAIVPVRGFMFKHTREKDLEVFIQASGDTKPTSRSQIKLYQLIPAFVLSELKTAFQIGFMIYVPFLVLDMVVASILMAMGMMMLPPILISLPFKLMLFVLVDGWNLLVGNLIKSFN
jgi:flagellar biosynthetic protein FliP